MLNLSLGMTRQDQHNKSSDEIPSSVVTREQAGQAIKDEDDTDRLAPPCRHHGGMGIGGNMCPNERSHESSTIKGHERKEIEPTDEKIDSSEIGGNGIRIGTPKGCGEDE